jgi:phage/plasmid-like protein (TIGR03299 family)
MSDHVENMAYVGATPWHGKGNELRKDTPIERWLTSAGLAWPVITTPATYTWVDPQGEAHTRTTDQHRLLIRGDTGDVLDRVGANYTPFQNAEVLEFFREYLDAGEAFIETAGSLKDGRYIWAMANLESGFQLGTAKQPDRVEGRVLVINPHKYGRGATVKLVSIAVVCWNTLQLALRGKGAELQLWHNRQFDEALRQDAKERLGIARDSLRSLREDAEALVSYPVVVKDAVPIIAELFKGDPTVDRDQQPRTVKRVVDLFDGEGIGATLDSRAETAWGLLNAVTQYVDHERGRSQDARLEFAWLGGGDSLKRRARVRLLELAGVGPAQDAA